MADCGGILRHLAVQQLVGAVVGRIDGVKAARTDAAAAALALVVVDDRLVFGIVSNGVRAALLGAAVAAAAQPLLHGGLAGSVLLHLARAGAAAHADILERTAKAGGLVALEVGQADEHIRIHDGAADLGGLAVFAVGHRHFHLIRAAQTVTNDHLTAGGHGPEAVQLGAAQVLQRILAAARVQGVAVGQEGHTALLLAQVCHHLGVVGTQKSQIAQLAEVHLDGHEPAVHVDILNAGGNAHPAQLFQQAGAHRTAEIRIVNFGCFHGVFPPISFRRRLPRGLSFVQAIPHDSKCRYGERGAADAKPKAQIILCVLSSILATQMPCRSRRNGA